MSDHSPLLPAGLAGLLSALQPRAAPLVPPEPLPDLDAVRSDAFASGFAAGEAAAATALAPLAHRMAAAAAALDRACMIDVDRLRPVFTTLVEQVCATVLCAELGAGAKVLQPLVDAALLRINIGAPATFEAHPDTLAALQPYLPAMVIAGNAALAADEFSISGPSFMIETGLSSRLAEIVEALA